MVKIYIPVFAFAFSLPPSSSIEYCTYVDIDKLEGAWVFDDIVELPYLHHNKSKDKSHIVKYRAPGDIRNNPVQNCFYKWEKWGSARLVGEDVIGIVRSKYKIVIQFPHLQVSAGLKLLLEFVSHCCCFSHSEELKFLHSIFQEGGI